MLQPKRTKFRKQHKRTGQSTGKAQRGTSVSFGEYGLQATGLCRISARQIEAARRAMNRYIKRGGQIWIRIFPDKPITQKPLEVRQGSGKGSVEYWVALVQPGRVLFEIAGVPRDVAEEAMRLASAKLPVGTQFIKREETAA
ncbi:MAG: 50S ribosomal protein L16 [Pseudomonadota bacterium]